MKKLIRQIVGVDLGRGRIATEDMHIFLYRDDKSGLAWVEDGSTGLGHSAHPNISATGSVKGMKSHGFWGKKDRTVRSHGFTYNIDRYVVSDPLDKIAATACDCAGCQERWAARQERMKEEEAL